MDKKKETKENIENPNIYITLLKFLTETIAWLAIVFSLSVFTGIISGITYLLISGNSGFIIATIIASIGVVMSIIYASYIWKTKGTVNFISNSSWKNNNTDLED